MNRHPADIYPTRSYGVRVYRKKPVVVEALQWTGANYVDIETFLESAKNGFFKGDVLYLYAGETAFRVLPGTWIIRGATGGFHPCRADAFTDVYELADTFHHPV